MDFAFAHTTRFGQEAIRPQHEANRISRRSNSLQAEVDTCAAKNRTAFSRLRRLQENRARRVPAFSAADARIELEDAACRRLGQEIVDAKQRPVDQCPVGGFETSDQNAGVSVIIAKREIDAFVAAAPVTDARAMIIPAAGFELNRLSVRKWIVMGFRALVEFDFNQAVRLAIGDKTCAIEQYCRDTAEPRIQCGIALVARRLEQAVPDHR